MDMDTEKILQEIKEWFASIVKGKECPKCGGIICQEKAEGVDYPYFCPNCDENFYEFETICH